MCPETACPPIIACSGFVQQRITTIYMMMTGQIPPYYTHKEITHDVRGLYVNLSTLELEYYKARTMENNPLWQELKDVFAGSPL